MRIAHRLASAAMVVTAFPAMKQTLAPVDRYRIPVTVSPEDVAQLGAIYAGMARRPLR